MMQITEDIIGSEGNRSKKNPFTEETTEQTKINHDQKTHQRKQLTQRKIFLPLSDSMVRWLSC